MKRVLNYNEQKVEHGQAQLIHAENFLKLPHQLDLDDKQKRFENLMMRNERALTKTIHISLNFHPSENEKLNKELLKEITDEYMKRIGFERQPYLVYQHHDAGHPHVHIVSTLIRNDGSRISTHNIGRSQSEKARKELEKIYGLVSANKNELQKNIEQKKSNVQKLKYGKAETKKSISNVVDFVTSQYKYASLQELNAALRQYNVVADRGREEGRIYKNRGLMYRMLDDNGKKIGVQIKASNIENKPTLANLEKKFLENELKRQPEMKRLKNSIDWTLVKLQKSLKEFVRALEQERVSAIVSNDKRNKEHGFIYVDHQTKSVFSESKLGKEYTAERIFERVGIEQSKANEFNNERDIKNENTLSNVLELMMKPEDSNEELVYELMDKYKQKKQKEHSREL